MAKIISAFPGVGKSYFYQNTNMKVLDSDSSKYSWKNGLRNPDFPNNYMIHIKENLSVDIILVSSHEVVRNALINEGLEYTLVFPQKELKEEYINRFKKRGSPESFIDLLSKNWNNWISELEEQQGCYKIKLKQGQYLSDILS